MSPHPRVALKFPRVGLFFPHRPFLPPSLFSLSFFNKNKEKEKEQGLKNKNGHPRVGGGAQFLIHGLAHPIHGFLWVMFCGLFQ
jgi:hypothetical protein